jgi:23S rRNA pseudouridine955/2504/2580 synthase
MVCVLNLVIFCISQTSSAFITPFFSGEIKTCRPLSTAWKDRIESWCLYEDDNIFVLNKPADLACQGGSGQKISLDELMKRYSDQQFRLVHRLDKPTTGILIFAKSLKSAQNLSEFFHERSIEKVYWALVHGAPSPSRGRINLPIFVDGQSTEALTFYQIQKQFQHPKHGLISFVHLLPRTGRKHQLRIHMAHKGHPIVGDMTYGSPSFAQDWQAETPLFLHCHQVTLPSGLQLKADPPELFMNLIRPFS